MSSNKECVSFWDEFKNKQLDLSSNESYERIIEDLNSQDTMIIISCDENKEDIKRLDKLGVLMSFMPDMMKILDMHKESCSFSRRLKRTIITTMRSSLKDLR